MFPSSSSMSATFGKSSSFLDSWLGSRRSNPWHELTNRRGYHLYDDDRCGTRCAWLLSIHACIRSLSRAFSLQRCVFFIVFGGKKNGQVAGEDEDRAKPGHLAHLPGLAWPYITVVMHQNLTNSFFVPHSSPTWRFEISLRLSSNSANTR